MHEYSTDCFCAIFRADRQVVVNVDVFGIILYNKLIKSSWLFIIHEECYKHANLNKNHNSKPRLNLLRINPQCRYKGHLRSE